MAPYGGPSFSGRNRSAKDGGPSGVQRNYATSLKEYEPLFNTYEHLSGLPRGDAALTLLRKVASTVKPIMRKHGWRVQILAEFLPPEGNLLGLNINRGYKICIRLRYHSNPDLFLPLEQIVDTMLHELSHNKWGDHDSKFHALWDELREEHETLVRKGYTGEGFIGEGRRLGGGRPPTERDLRQLARAGAEKRKTLSTLSSGSGRRLGGSDIMSGQDAREVIAGQALLRNTVNKGCASTRSDAGSLAMSSANPTFKTKAEEDDANDRAITQAIYELMEEEEMAKMNRTFTSEPSTGGLAWDKNYGLYDPKTERPRQPTEDEQLEWAMAESVRSGSSNRSSGPKTSGALPPESLISPIKPLYASSSRSSTRSTHSRATSTTSSAQPSSTISPISPVRSSRQSISSTPRAPPLTDPSPVSPLYPDSSPPKRKASTTIPPRKPVSSRASTRSESVVTSPPIDLSEPFNPDQWTCEICTCINPTQYLACDACGIERPQPMARRHTIRSTAPRETASSRSSVAPTRSGGSVVSSASVRSRRSEAPPTSLFASRPRERETMGWNCLRCGTFMEHKYWCCSACGTMKESS